MLADVYAHFERALADRFRYDMGYAQDYTYDAEYDVISFVGMLLLIPLEQRRATLERAWEALRPGGVLIVLEVPKSDASKSYDYYDSMLTEVEIGDIMSFSDVFFLDLKGLFPVPATEGAVFRFMQKPL